MNIKKFLILILSVFSFTTASLKPEAPVQAITLENSQEIQQEAALQEDELISICQQIQKECSKQIDFLTSILQQTIGSVQKGSIKASLDKKALSQKLYEYISLMHLLQGMSVMTANHETLMQVTVILKNVIDRLTVAFDAQLTILEVPDIEDLLVTDKNFTPTFEYLFKLLTKNERRLNELVLKSTSLGLTTINKTIRSLENFCQNYKWPLFMAGCAGAGLMFYQWQKMPLTIESPNQTNGSWLYDIIKNHSPSFDSAALTVAVVSGLFKDQLTLVGNYVVNTAYKSITKKYNKIKTFCAESYDVLKGINNVKREGLATSLDNVPDLDDESLIGLEDQKKELYKILEYLGDPELYIRSDNEIAKCIMAIGPSRCGKTALIKALGATINKHYEEVGSSLKIKFIEINYLMINSAPGMLQEIIEYAKASAPCILFIDEIHLLGLQKTGDKGLLNDFLTQLTELHKIKDPLKQVFIIAATNHPELLAPELFKHERFGKVIRFKKPGITERANFFLSSFKKYGINPEVIDLKSIVLQTKECDFGHLQQIIKDARFEARARGQGVNQEHLQRAINSLVHGLNSTAELSKEETLIAAIDQAGKIVTHYALGIHETIHLATINKVDGKIEEDILWISDKKDTEVIPARYGTIISTSNREEIPFSDAIELEKLCKRYLSGIAAQQIILGTYYIDYTAQDYRNAFDIAQKIVLKGLTLKTLPPEQQDRIFQETQKLMTQFEAEILELLKTQKSLIEKLVKELIKDRCLTGKDIESIVQ